MTLLTVGGKQLRHATYERDILAPWCQEMLAKSRGGRLSAQCHCTHPARKLVLRKLGELHFLAAWPGDAASHAPSCRFHSRAPALSSAQASAVQGLPQGFRVKLALDLTGEIDQVAQVLAPDAPSTTKAPPHAPLKLGPIHLLQHLWARARLNAWAPGWSRDYWRVWHALRHGMSQGQLDTGEPLLDVIYVPRPFRRDLKDEIDREWADFSQVLCVVDGRKVHRRLILGECREIQREQDGYILAIKHLKTKLHITQAVHDRMYRSFSRAMSSIGKSLQHASRVMVLAVVQPDAGGIHLETVDAAFLLCNSMWIPASTGYEVALADSLVEQARRFEKPLASEEVETELADFLLLDTSPATALEVFGLTSLSYEERKFAVIAQLRRAGLEVWAWRAAAGDAVPRLPPILR